MLKKLNLPVLALTALTAGTLMTTAGPAHAEKPARLKAMSFTAQSMPQQQFHVISTDKKKWNKIKSGQAWFNGHMMIDVKGLATVKDMGIVLGSCGGASCKGKPLLWYHGVPTRKFETQKAIKVSTGQVPVSSGGGVASLPFGDQMIARCNEHLSASGPTQAYSFNYLMQATFIADTTKRNELRNKGGLGGLPGEIPAKWNHEVDEARSATFMVKVNCDPSEPEAAEDVPDDPDFGAKGVQLFLSTFVGQTSQPNPGTVCKKARVLARIKTTKPGPVKFRLWTKIGNQPSQSEFIQAWSSQSGSEFKAEVIKWISVSKTTNVQAMVEDLTNPIGQSTGWKDITLHCTGAGGGGLTDAPNPNDDGPLVSPLKVTGELTLADKAGAPKNKPRLGQAVFKIWATKPGSTSYKLTCSGGRKWEGTLPTFKVADKKYQAVGAANFQIAKTEQIGCALRSTSKSGDPVIALATKLFKLVKVNPNVGGAGGLTTKPTLGKPKLPKFKVAPKPKLPKFKVAPKSKLPKIKVAPLPKVVCIGGKIASNKCFCSAKTKRVKVGANAYRCIINVVKPKRMKPKAQLKQTSPAKVRRLIGKKTRSSALAR